eukprot:TRINITY_DN64867_c0_g1_i1.p2 TRINITY_DN64867_c0_g1~~TRINITY_DN64867_c0_g1_i1.p2  ORF type:complete len:416 (+),score=76.10 TRINITY_DN64867_c0_g1_i1:143-1390(+)
MPVPFLAGVAVVSKTSGALGLAAALADYVVQVVKVAAKPPEQIDIHGNTRRNRAARENDPRCACANLQRGVGAVDLHRVFVVFAAGTGVGCLSAAAYIHLVGMSTTAVPLTQIPTVDTFLLALAGGALWLPVHASLLSADDGFGPEARVPNHFLHSLVLGTSLFALPKALGLKNLAASCTAVMASTSALMLFVFVNQYSWMQAHKRPPHGMELGPMVETSSRWLIALGAVSGNLLAAAICTTPWYHPGHFLVWGITNPGLMYTMSIMAEAEIESEQVHVYLHSTDDDGKLIISPDAYMRIRLVRAMLPLSGLPFAYVADREDVAEWAKIGLAGMGALGLGLIVATFQNEWTALLVDDYPNIQCNEVLSYVESPARGPRTAQSGNRAREKEPAAEPESPRGMSSPAPTGNLQSTFV